MAFCDKIVLTEHRIHYPRSKVLWMKATTQHFCLSPYFIARSFQSKMKFCGKGQVRISVVLDETSSHWFSVSAIPLVNFLSTLLLVANLLLSILLLLTTLVVQVQIQKTLVVLTCIHVSLEIGASNTLDAMPDKCLKFGAGMLGVSTHSTYNGHWVTKQFGMDYTAKFGEYL